MPCLGLRPAAVGGQHHAIDIGAVVAEEDGVLESWFDRHGCRAAIVRPDHYVFGVANDKSALGKMLSELATRLQ